MEEEGWRDKETVRGIALVDFISALFLFGFYVVGLFTNTIIVDVPNGLFNKFNLFLLSVVVWITVFTVTVLQITSAYKLFLVTYQDVLGPSVSIQRSQLWLRTAACVFVLIALKIIYFLVRKQGTSVLVWVLCLLEFTFRIFGTYFVIEFKDDLKHQIGSLRRTVSFIKYIDNHNHNNSIRRPHVTIEM